MVDAREDHETVSHSARQAVGVFNNADSLEGAVDEIEISGFNRAGSMGSEIYVDRAPHRNPNAPPVALKSRNMRQSIPNASATIPFSWRNTLRKRERATITGPYGANAASVF
jgi:hypothetical protein